MRPISIVMPVLGQSKYTQSFFETFYKTVTEEYELIVINNGKDKETKDLLAEQVSKNTKIKVIENEENTGVSASWNQGIKESEYDYICIVNNDIEFLSMSWLSEMQKTIDKIPNVYWTSPTTSYTKDPKKQCFKIHHYEQLRYGNHMNDSFAPYIVGCCFMCPRKAFDDIGLFDEDFDIKYYEDLDFINRILQSKNRLMMTRPALIYHAVGATSRITPGGGDNESYYKKKWGNSKFEILSKQPPRIKSAKHFS